MTGNEAGEVELPGTREMPDDLDRAPRLQAAGVGFVVRHVGRVLHGLHVREVLLERRQHQLVLELAIVAQPQADLLASADLDAIGHEHHPPLGLAHGDAHDARRLARIARLAVGLPGGGIAVVVVTRTGQCGERQANGGQRREQIGSGLIGLLSAADCPALPAARRSWSAGRLRCRHGRRAPRNAAGGR